MIKPTASNHDYSLALDFSTFELNYRAHLWALAYGTSTAVAYLTRLTAAGQQMLYLVGSFKVFRRYIQQDHIQNHKLIPLTAVFKD